MKRNKRSFIMQDIMLKNLNGCMNYLKAFKNFLIFKSSRKDMILFDAHTPQVVLQ